MLWVLRGARAAPEFRASSAARERRATGSCAAPAPLGFRSPLSRPNLTKLGPRLFDEAGRSLADIGRSLAEDRPTVGRLRAKLGRDQDRTAHGGANLTKTHTRPNVGNTWSFIAWSPLRARCGRNRARSCAQVGPRSGRTSPIPIKVAPDLAKLGPPPAHAVRRRTQGDEASCEALRSAGARSGPGRALPAQAQAQCRDIEYEFQARNRTRHEEVASLSEAIAILEAHPPPPDRSCRSRGPDLAAAGAQHLRRGRSADCVRCAADEAPVKHGRSASLVLLPECCTYLDGGGNALVPRLRARLFDRLASQRDTTWRTRVCLAHRKVEARPGARRAHPRPPVRIGSAYAVLLSKCSGGGIVPPSGAAPTWPRACYGPSTSATVSRHRTKFHGHRWKSGQIWPDLGQVWARFNQTPRRWVTQQCSTAQPPSTSLGLWHSPLANRHSRASWAGLSLGGRIPAASTWPRAPLVRLDRHS